MDKKKKPLGVFILGGLNCFVFGILFLYLSLSTYLKVTVEDFNKIIEIFKNKGILAQITYQQFKTACLIYAFISFIFFLSGSGLLLKKKWARILTIYFAFAALIVTFLSAFSAPSLVKQAFLQVIYPAILIIYFTNRNVEAYFDNNKSLPEKQVLGEK